MLSRTAAFLGIERGSVFRLTKFAVHRRHFSQDVSHDEEERGEGFSCSNFSVDDFENLLKSEEDRQKCHLILLEINSLADDTGRAPTSIRSRDMEELLSHSVFQRKKYYDYMFKREQSIKNQKAKKALSRMSREERLRTTPREIPTGLFPFIREQTQFNCLHGRRLAGAAMFSQKIVFDFSYNENMSKREIRNLANQVQLCYAVNKTHHTPFDITICNLEKDSFSDKMLRQLFAIEDLRRLLIGTTEKSYLDLFPREDLVYLSPDAPHPLQWDPSKTFIIGGLVDLGAEKPLSLAKAKRERIQVARLPIFEHVCLQQGAQKTLTLNTVVEILLEMKVKNDWTEALKKLPRRLVAKLGTSNTVARSRIMNRARKESFAAPSYSPLPPLFKSRGE